MKQFIGHGLVPVKVSRSFLPQKEKVKFKPAADQLWLVKEGGFGLTVTGAKERRIHKGEIVFFSQGESYVLTIKANTQIYCFTYGSLLPFLGEVWPEGMEEIPVTRGRLTSSLPMDLSLKDYVRHLDVLLSQTGFTDEWLSIQGTYLLILLKNSYSRSQVASFFSPILQRPDPFKEFVLHVADRVKTARKLAHLCHLSIRSLERRFKETFGIPPGEWLLKRRIENVRHKIITSHQPLSLVADQCGFSTTSQLSDFCRKYLGKTPSQLRKGSTT